MRPILATQRREHPAGRALKTRQRQRLGSRGRRGAHSPGAAPRLGFPALPRGANASSSELRWDQIVRAQESAVSLSHRFDSAGAKGFSWSPRRPCCVGLTSRRDDVDPRRSPTRKQDTPAPPGPSPGRKRLLAGVRGQANRWVL